MTKILITGFSGFVARHFLEQLKQGDASYYVQGIDINKPDFQWENTKKISAVFRQCNLLNRNDLEDIFCNFVPDYILHLAAFSSVGFSWQSPELCIKNNIDIFLNLMEILRKIGYKGRILSVGSSEEYGNYPEDMLPLKEEYTLYPTSPYAAARVTQENLSRIYADGFDLDIVMTRSFNHIGPGQREKFVIPSFAKQLVGIAKGATDRKEIITGDIDIVRDFLDVRDVVDAYYKLLKAGRKGEVYNICSGQGKSLRELITKMSNMLNISVDIVQNKQLIRPNENKNIVGCNDKIIKETGWKQKITIDESLNDILNYLKTK